MNKLNDMQELRAENKQLRTLLAITYSKHRLYTEDGKIEDSSEYPTIDFKNDAAGEIDKKIMIRATDAAKRESKNDGAVRKFFAKITPFIMSDKFLPMGK